MPRGTRAVRALRQRVLVSPGRPNDAYEAPEDLAGFAELVESGDYAKLANLGPNEVQVVLNESVQSMLLGNDTPQSVADKMQAAFDAGT